MIAELVKEDKKYTYRIKSKKEVVLQSRYYKTKRTAIKGFKRFNNSVKTGRVVICNDFGCYYVEIVGANNQIIAESINLKTKNRLSSLRRRLKRQLILKDTETRKMRTYIQNIGDIQLKEPLTVEIKKGDDYVASIDRLNLFAYGNNIEEVIKELKEDLLDLYNDLFNGNYKLAKPAIEMKSYMEKLQK